MKRSRTAALLLMGTAPILLTACNSDREASRQGLYTSVEACVAATKSGSPATEKPNGFPADRWASAQANALATSVCSSPSRMSML